ncbi:hypothetical protein DDQ41_04190 [Streptomyces spongiicola]|uniref:Uncharacterized protein n=1 Tax=Streptomyces spongiicola TaxID=1690221 RepID=A0ABM6V2Y0_9ACTN|nr:hypothetical protein DDQ41_04190 [Streptomyces spongiicola]
MIPSPGPGTASPALSPECAVASRPGYQDVHGQCRQTGDVPLPYATGLLLVHRCTCLCHGYDRQGTRPPWPGRGPQGARAARPAPDRPAGGTGSNPNVTTIPRRSSP